MNIISTDPLTIVFFLGDLLINRDEDTYHVRHDSETIDWMLRQMIQQATPALDEKRGHEKTRNEKQIQRKRRVRENLECYQNIQPVIDSERQLAGKIVDEEVIGALERTGYMTPQHMMLIDNVLTTLGTTTKAEIQRWICCNQCDSCLLRCGRGRAATSPPLKEA